MPIVAHLEDLRPAEFLLMLSLNQKTGQLTAERGDRKVVIAFRNGDIVYAASNGVRETIGSMLVSRKLVSDNDVRQALAIQQRSPVVKHLGNILIEMGAIGRCSLEEVIQEQFQKVLREVLGWPDGIATFEPKEIPDLGAVRVNAREIVLDIGLDTEHLVLEGMTQIDDDSRDREPAMRRSQREEPPSPASPSGEAMIRSMMNEMTRLSVAVTLEDTTELLEHAATTLRRGALLLVFPDCVSAAGGFGAAGTMSAGPDNSYRFSLPHQDDSVLSWVIAERRTYLGRLKESPTNAALIQALGGIVPQEVVVVPMIIEAIVVALLYGDNAPGKKPIGPANTLERLVARIARNIEGRRHPNP
jgi:hypothetical protein